MIEKNFPLVSVVIPMYNSAKYIPQTLESLFYQTMKNFEVVVVDDCSTDNSVEVVESFVDKFANGGGVKLSVVKLPKNTGTPGLPRNVGIQLARGKYISFLDSDDFFTRTALEELTTLAEKFQVDVLKLGVNFVLWKGMPKSVDDPAFTDPNEIFNPKNLNISVHRKEQLTQPTFEPESLAERVNRWINLNSLWTPWLTFYRRNFLITNQILFPNMGDFEDAPFTFEALCLAKKYLNVPNVTYVIRPRVGSTARKVPNQENFSKIMRTVVQGFKEFERIMDGFPFFKEHPDYRYAILNWVIREKLNSTLIYYLKVPPFVLNQFVEREFQSNNATISAELFSMVNIQRLQIMYLQQELAKLQHNQKQE